MYGTIVSSPVSFPNSGSECEFLILIKLPILIGEFALSKVEVPLALLNETVDVPILSISYPLTYALPGDICKTNFSSTPPFTLV